MNVYKERMRYRNDLIVVAYTIEPPEPDIGVVGGVCIEYIESFPEGSKGPQGVSYDEMCEEIAREISEDLGLGG